MTDWTGFLSRDTRKALRAILLKNGFDDGPAFRQLFTDIETRYRASLPGDTLNGLMRIDAKLAAMNKTVSLTNGTRPLSQFLTAMLDVTFEAADIAVVEDALARVNMGGGPPTAPITAAEIFAARGANRINTSPMLPSAAPPALPRASIKGEVEQEALIGRINETLPVSFLRGGLSRAASVFKLIIHSHADGHPIFGADDTALRSFGTAWMIGRGIAITNFHVFNARQSFEPAASDVDYAMQVQTAQLVPDFHDTPEPVGLVLPADALLARDATLDFAIFKVPDAVADRAPLVLRRNAMRKTPQNAMGLRVNVLQHPGGGAMRLGFRSNFVVLGNEDRLTYLTDTAKGSSGAPVMDDGWGVAAIHAGSQSIGVEGIEILGTRIRKENYGIPMKRIMDHLTTHDPDVAAMITGAGVGT